MDKTAQQAWYLWAKSDQNYQQDGRWLPLLTHLLDVAACAWEILELEPPRTRELFAQDYGLEPLAAQQLVCALVGLHDLGKASPTFQRLWDMSQKHPLVGVERLITALQGTPHPHGEVSQVLLEGLLKQLNLPERLAAKVADAVGCHHGRRSSGPNVPTAERGGGEWRAAQQHLTKMVFTGTGVSKMPTLPDLSAPAFMRLAGLTSFADWVGSSFEVPSTLNTLPIENPAAYFEQARAQARTKLAEIGWTKRAALQDNVQSPAELFSYLPNFQPRQLQLQLAAALEKLDAEPALILVEAPMGEGKTEAGLHAATWLQSKLGHRGLYVALPTQATGNAMYTRVTEFLHYAATGREIVPDLQLLHGGTLLNKNYQDALERTKNPQNDPSTAEEAKLNVRAENWFSVRKRANLTEYGVGTVDQALLGVLGVPHQFVRLWGLGNRVVLLDEIHAYDTYTSRLIHALLSWLHALNSSMIIMSATLPAQSRRELLAAWGAVDEGEVADYPRLTLAQGNAARSEHIAASRPQTPITVRALEAEGVAAKALELAVNGGCVAVIVNTVQRAQDVFKEVKKRYAGRLKSMRTQGANDDLCALIFHARYPADEREKREQAVLKYLGTQPKKDGKDHRPRRLILIATQVAEQSLDFDADVMITDLAPMDLLLQRAGRLHRHAANAQRRHAHTTPQLWVAGLNAWPEQAMKEQAWQYVYAPHLLYRTWLALKEGHTITLPADLDILVQQVYGDMPLLPGTDERATVISTAEAKFKLDLNNDQLLGGFAHIGLPDQFFGRSIHIQPEPDGEPQHDDADPDWPQTRKGEKSVRVVPVFSVEAATWLDEKGSVSAFLKGSKLSAHQAAAIFRRSLRVARWQLVKNAESVAPPHPSWQEHSLIQDCLPLAFRQVNSNWVATEIQGLTVKLDAELGLVYVRPDSDQS